MYFAEIETSVMYASQYTPLDTPHYMALLRWLQSNLAIAERKDYKVYSVMTRFPA